MDHKIGEPETKDAEVDAQLSPNPPKRPWSLRKKIIITAIGLIILAPLTLFGIIYVGFSGGLGQTFLSLKPALNPHSSSIEAKRSKTKNLIKNDLNRLETAAGLKNSGIAYADICYRGQHNYEVKDDFANQCTYKETRYYGFSGDFKTKLLNIDTALSSSGWTPPPLSPHDSIPYVLTNYYDRYYGTNDPTILRNHGGQYRVSDLPSSGYAKKDAGYDLDLSINYAQKDTPSFFLLGYQQKSSGYDETYESSNLLDTNSTFSKILKDNDYLVGISVRQQYFEN